MFSRPSSLSGPRPVIFKTLFLIWLLFLVSVVGSYPVHLLAYQRESCHRTCQRTQERCTGHDMSKHIAQNSMFLPIASQQRIIQQDVHVHFLCRVLCSCSFNLNFKNENASNTCLDKYWNWDLANSEIAKELQYLATSGMYYKIANSAGGFNCCSGIISSSVHRDLSLVSTGMRTV